MAAQHLRDVHFFSWPGSASDMWCDVFFANCNSVVCYKAQMYWPAQTMVRVSFSWGAVLGEVPSWVEYHFLWQTDSTLHNLHCTRDSSLYPLHTLHSKCYTSTLRSSTVQSTHHTPLHSTLRTLHSTLGPLHFAFHTPYFTLKVFFLWELLVSLEMVASGGSLEVVRQILDA